MTSGYDDNQAPNSARTGDALCVPGQPSARRPGLGRVITQTDPVDSRGRDAMEAEFEAFVRGQFVALSGFGRLLAAHEAHGQDLVQEALARTYLRWRRHGAPDDPVAYVRRTMVNLHATWWRRLFSRESGGELPESVATEADHDLRLSVWSVLQALPPRHRAVIVLRYYERLTEVEVADVLECSVGTVKSQSSKALAKLRVDPSMLAAHKETEL